MERLESFHEDLSSFVTAELVKNAEFREWVRNRVVGKLIGELESRNEAVPVKPATPPTHSERVVQQKLRDLSTSLTLLEQALALLSQHDIQRRSMLLTDYEEGRTKKVDVGAFYYAGILVAKLETEAATVTKRGFNQLATATSIERFSGTIRSLVRLGKTLNKILSDLTLSNLRSTSSSATDYVLLIRKVSAALINFPHLNLTSLVAALRIFSENVVAPLLQLSQKWDGIEKKAIERMELDLESEKRKKELVHKKTPNLRTQKSFLLSPTLRIKRAEMRMKTPAEKERTPFKRMCPVTTVPASTTKPKQRIGPRIPERPSSASMLRESSVGTGQCRLRRLSADSTSPPSSSSQQEQLNQAVWEKLVESEVMKACMELDEACDGAVERLAREEIRVS